MSLEHTIIVVCIVILIVMSLIIIPFILLKIKMKRSIAFCNEKDDFLSSEPFIDHFTKIRALDLNLGKLEEKKKIENFANKNPELEQEIESIEQHRNKLGELEITLSKQLNLMRNYHKKASDNLEIKKIFPLLKILKE